MAHPVLFYISGHGYGHARRSAQVVRALRELNPSIDIHIRTTAPARILAGLVPTSNVTPCEIDAGAAEFSALEIDAAGTLDRIETVLDGRERIVQQELAVVRQIKPRVIASDIPFLAGAVAEAAGVPCWGMSNFTWDWIIEPFVRRLKRSEGTLDSIGRHYASMAGILRMPLGGISNVFQKVVEVPLVANRSRREPADVLRQLGLDPKDDRRRVLFGIRGAIPTAVLSTAAATATDFLILCPTNEPGDVPPGVHPAHIGGDLDFSDVLQVCDVVVGKMGYGLIAECIVSNAALLWPRRIGFREDEIVERDGLNVMRMRELPMEDFRTGRWADHIRKAAELPQPPQRLQADGAEVCARHIANV